MYDTDDVVGVEFGAALNNVLAIACGVSDGAGLGTNARAALITRGISGGRGSWRRRRAWTCRSLSRFDARRDLAGRGRRSERGWRGVPSFRKQTARSIDTRTFQCHVESVTLRELAAAADVTERTVRYYIVHGLLAPPSGAGLGASYGDEHLRLLLAINQLKRQQVPLAVIRERLLGEPPPAADEPPARPAISPRAAGPEGQSALDYIQRALGGTSSASSAPEKVALLSHGPGASPHAALGQRSTWERHRLAPDLELHVRRPLTRDQQKRLERLLDAARDILSDPKGKSP